MGDFFFCSTCMESTGVWERETLDSDSLVLVRAAWNDEFDFSVIGIAKLGTSVVLTTPPPHTNTPNSVVKR